MPASERIGPPLLSFSRTLVIVGGGRVDFDILAGLVASGAHMVGADGGADLIAQAGVVPDAIIGDLDSLADPQGWARRTRVIHVAEQETTDFEKALYCTRAPVTVALGMTGGRFDHTLAALDAVLRHAHERALILVDEEDVALAATGPVRFTVGRGERISIHPLGPARFLGSEGLDYPLQGVELKPGGRTGTSNVATNGTFSIEPEPGAAPYLLILGQRNLMALIEMAGQSAK
ncbi:thiamine diphosphokinase [Arsenicitalea aurantiaca]|uniref:thiamine diphosphokinase n=1 Tax=Arsenicitalea aurantiaca TaxID=1783274 RepID=UPI001FCEA2DF|nr:thiamine diphosphokinase [Arsenicitalea aurantiaca]